MQKLGDLVVIWRTLLLKLQLEAEKVWKIGSQLGCDFVATGDNT